jgi:hypothetical protein
MTTRVKLDLEFTFVAAIYLGLADESGGVNLVAAQKHVVRVRVASADIAASASSAPSIVAFVLGIVVSTEKAIELFFG